MTTAKREFLSKILNKRYGVLGKIAGRYVRAGYDIREVYLDDGSFLASKKGERLLVKAIWNVDRIDDTILDRLREKASKLNAKPVLIIYGRKPSVGSLRSVIDSIKARGISYRRIIPDRGRK